MSKEKNVMALDALKAMSDAVESIRVAGATAMETLILMKTPCNKESMTLAMLLQASLSFSVALNKWIELCEEQEATIINMNTNGN